MSNQKALFYVTAKNWTKLYDLSGIFSLNLTILKIQN